MHPDEGLVVSIFIVRALKGPTGNRPVCAPGMQRTKDVAAAVAAHGNPIGDRVTSQIVDWSVPEPARNADAGRQS